MAQQFGVHRNVYNRFESIKSVGADEEPPHLEYKPIDYMISPLKSHEKCFLYRRRAGKSQQQVADDLGVSRCWVNRMETGKVDCSPLVEYWEV